MADPQISSYCKMEKLHDQCYTTMEKNELLLDASTWMNITNIMLNKTRHIKQCILYGSIYIKLKKYKIYLWCYKSGYWLPLEAGQWTEGDRRSFWSAGDVLFQISSLYSLWENSLNHIFKTRLFFSKYFILQHNLYCYYFIFICIHLYIYIQLYLGITDTQGTAHT